MIPRRLLFLLVLVLFSLTGCRHMCCKKRPNCVAPPPGSPPPRGALLESPNLPPQNIPLDPPPGGSSSQRQPEILLPDNRPPSSNISQYPSLAPPATVLEEPQFGQARANVTEAAPRTDGVTPPPRSSTDKAMSPFPVGIAEFAQVKEGIHSGLRPELIGLDWLAENNYRSVLYLKRPTEDDSSDRKQVELRGMKYQSLVIRPEQIDRDLVKEFNDFVTDKKNQPMLVYDRNGTIAGAMWYLHFREVDKLDDESARTRAAKHGLKTQANDEAIQLWTAVQKYLADTTP